MRSLYLDPGSCLRVAADGPSLELTREGTAARWIPLRRLARITVCGPAVLTAESLTACLERGIVVAFLRRDGSLAGTALPARPKPTRTLERLERLLARPDGRGLYENWRRSAERAAILSVLRQVGRWVTDLRAATVERVLVAEVRGREEAEVRRGKQYLDALARLRLTSLLHAAGCDLAALAARAPEFRLAEDLTAIAGWQHYADLKRDLGEPGAAAPGTGREWRRWLTARAEARASRDHQRLERLWHGFLAWLGSGDGYA